MNTNVISWLNFDWEDYNSTNADGGVRVLASTDAEVIKVLENNQESIENTFEYEDDHGDRMVFVPNKVNGQDVNHNGRTIKSLSFVIEAIIQYLQLNPGMMAIQ